MSTEWCTRLFSPLALALALIVLHVFAGRCLTTPGTTYQLLNSKIKRKQWVALFLCLRDREWNGKKERRAMQRERKEKQLSIVSTAKDAREFLCIDRKPSWSRFLTPSISHCSSTPPVDDYRRHLDFRRAATVLSFRNSRADFGCHSIWNSLKVNRFWFRMPRSRAQMIDLLPRTNADRLLGEVLSSE